MYKKKRKQKIKGIIEATPEQLEKMSEEFTEVMFKIVMNRLNKGEQIIPSKKLNSARKVEK